MVDTDPSLAESRDASAWDANDGAAQTDHTAALTDNDLAVGVVKQGKSPDDIVRCEFPNLSTIAVNDTVTIRKVGTHNYVNMALLPYNGASSVEIKSGLSETAADPTTFTLTQDFIDVLADQGGGTWACRIVESGEIDGDVNLSEVQSDLTTDGAVIVVHPDHLIVHSL